MKKILSLLLALTLLLGLIPSASVATAQQAADGSITVTLRIEQDETGLTGPVELTLSPQQLSEYGLTTSSNPDFITPLHVLAEYFTEYEGASPDNMKDYIGLNEWGYLQTIAGSTGASGEQTDVYWMFAVNDCTPMDPDTHYGYTMDTYPVQDGDEIVVYGVWSGVYGVVSSYYSAFDKTEYTVKPNEPLTVSLKGVDIYDLTASKPYLPISDAVILCDEQQQAGDTASSYTEFITDETGNATLTFDKEGVYVLSAARWNENYGLIDISRPYAVVTVTQGTQEDESILTSAVQWLASQYPEGSPLALQQYQLRSENMGAQKDTNLTNLLASQLNGVGFESVSVYINQSQVAGIAPDGEITYGDTAQQGNVSLLLEKNGVTVPAAVEVQIPRRMGTLEEELKAALQSLEEADFLGSNQRADAIYTDLTLPATAGTEAALTYESSNPDVIGNDGKVTRPAAGQPDAEGTLTVTASASPTASAPGPDAKQARTFTWTVKAITAEELTQDAEWDSFRGKTYGITTAKTPTSASDVDVTFSRKLTTGWDGLSAPLIAGNSIYVATGSRLLKLSKGGDVLLEAPLAASIGYFSYPAFGEGKIFVPISGGRVQAFDAVTLEPLWISEELSLQSLSPIVYNNGYVYTGVTSANGTKGQYFCLNAEDSDPSRTDEINPAVWSYVPSSGSAGYYWSGAAITDDAILFAGDEGVLYSHSLTSDEIYDSIVLPSGVRSGVVYDETEGAAFVATQDGKICRVESDGKSFGALETVQLPGTNPASTSTPVVVNGRLYVGSSDGLAQGYLNVVDTKSMQLVYSASVEGAVQSSPLVSTGYASAENDETVYVYFTSNGGVGGVYCLKDSQNATQPELTELYIPEKDSQQYCTASVIADENGTLYYVNDSGTLFALSAKEASSSNEGSGQESTPAPTPTPAPETGETGAAGIAMSLAVLSAAGLWLSRRRKAAR